MKHLLRFSLFILVTYCLLYFLPSKAWGQQEFKVDFDATYILNEKGTASVTQNINLTNNFSTIYATSYTLTLEGDKPENIEIKQDQTALPFEIIQDDLLTKININFPDSVVGKSKSRNFTVTYTQVNIGTQNGQVWEVAIPRLGETEKIDTYNLTIKIPSTYGKVAYISPKPTNETTDNKNYTFSYVKDQIAKAGVVGAFGDFQVFNFAVNYHLQNPYKNRSGKTEIALIPDTAFQRVYYEEISPRPENIKLDSDGNWLATFILKPEQKVTVNAEGQVQVFAKEQPNYPKIDPIKNNYYLSSSTFWPTNNEKIKNISSNLKSSREIYDYVVETLKYDYSRVKQGVTRLGALSALDSPNSAVCTEFTDLFVTLARARNIPSREINGYAYTENPEIQPLSLLADVLHAWPEYWDNNDKLWKPVDPTWGNTTGGVDFFDKFDLSHITFAIHGQSPTSPLPAGSYKTNDTATRDVTVEFGKLPPTKNTKPQITVIAPDLTLPGQRSEVKVKVNNLGPSAYYNLKLAITSNDVNFEKVGLVIPFLAPFTTQTYAFTFKNKFELFDFSKNESEVLVTLDNTSKNFTFPQRKARLFGIAIIFTLLCIILLLSFVIGKNLKKLKILKK